MIYNQTNNINNKLEIMSIHTHSNHFLASKYSQRQKSITSNKYKSVIFLTKRIAGLSSISKIQKMTRYDAIQPDKQLIQTARNKEKIIQDQIQSIQNEMGGIMPQDKIKALMKPVYRGKNCKTNSKVLDILRVKSQMQTQRKCPVQNTYTSRNKNNRNTITHTDTNKRKPTYQYSCHKRKNLTQTGHKNLTLIGNSNKKKLQQSKSQFSDQKLLLLSQKNIIIPVINNNTIQSLKQDENKSRLRISTQNDDYICKSNRVDHHKSQITYQNQFKKSQRRYAHLRQLQEFLDIDIDVKDGTQNDKEKSKDYAQLQYQEYLNQNIIPEKIAKIRKIKKKIHPKDKQYLIPRNGLYMSMYMRMHNHTQQQQMSYNQQSHGKNEVQMLKNKAMEQQLRKSKKKSKKYLIKNYSFSQIHSMCKLGSPRTNKSNDFYKSYDKNKITKNESANQQENKIENPIVNNNFVNISGKSFQKSNKRNQKNSTIKSKTYFNNLKYRYSKNNGNLALDLHGPTIVIDPW